MKKRTALVIAGIIATTTMLLYCVHTFSKPPHQDTTQIRVINESQDSALMFLTLSGYPYPQDTLFIQNVNGIFNCTQSGLQGSTWIAPGDTLTYTPTLSLSGNISFATPPLNCPTAQFPTGMNLFEFNLNEPQESIDISCMAGVNCIMRVNLIGGPDWPANIIKNPRTIQNDSMYHNSNRVGVYPYGCTNCTDTAGRQPCQFPTDTPNKFPICNPTRAKNQHGGIVQVSFLGYTNTQICKQKQP